MWLCNEAKHGSVMASSSMASDDLCLNSLIVLRSLVPPLRTDHSYCGLIAVEGPNLKAYISAYIINPP
jgi:hypothetical protein